MGVHLPRLKEGVLRSPGGDLRPVLALLSHAMGDFGGQPFHETTQGCDVVLCRAPFARLLGLEMVPRHHRLLFLRIANGPPGDQVDLAAASPFEANHLRRHLNIDGNRSFPRVEVDVVGSQEHG